MARENEASDGPARSRGLQWATIALIAAVGLALYMRPEPMAPDRALAPDEEPVAVATPESAPATADAPTPAADTTGAPADAPAERETAQNGAAPPTAGAPADEGVTASQDLAADARARPMIDEVRLEADGVLVVAGRAAPGDEVGLLVDGEEIGSGRADGSGAFAAIALLDQTDRARVLTLRARGASGDLVSLDEVILAPRGAALADHTVALAEPQESPSSETPVAAAVSAAAPAPVAAAEPAETAPASDVAASDRAAPADAPAGTVPEEPAVAEATGAESAAENPPSSGDDVVAILRSTEESVTLVQPALPDAAAVALDTIGYSDAGAVQLAGRATRTDREVRIYLDNRPVARLPLEENGTWRGEVPDVNTGVYTLRVDAVNAAGEVTSRVETPFQRESPAALAAAANGTTGVVRAVTVQAGDTLWAIARDRYGEGVLYVRVFEANREAIRDPDLIYPGQIFDLPPG